MFFMFCFFGYIQCTPKAISQSHDSVSSVKIELAAVMKDPIMFNRIHDIEVHEGIAYLAGKGGSLATVDVKDPVKPRILWSVRDSVKYEDAETVMVLGNNRLLAGTRDAILFDITDPAQPRLLDKIENREFIDQINGFARRGNIVFGSNKRGYFFALDVSSPDRLSLVGSRETKKNDGLDSPHDIAFCDEFLVVVSPQGFSDKPGRVAVYRVFDPASGNLLPDTKWERIGQYENLRLAGANRIKTQGRLICVGSSLRQTYVGKNPDIRGNVAFIDLNDPSNPRLRGSIDFPSQRGLNGLEFIGNTAFAAGGLIQVIDVNDPDKPQQVAMLSRPDAFTVSNDLVLIDDFLFCTSSSALVIIHFKH